MSADEFSPEQQVVIAIMRYQGTPDPESIVLEERLLAYNLGAHLEPVLQRMCKAWTEVIKTLDLH